MDVVLLLIMAAAGLSSVSSLGENHYYVVHELKNLNEARIYCREKYTDLATVHSEEDVMVMKDMFSSQIKNATSFWIGLYKDPDSQSCSLSNMDFHNFAETKSVHGEPCRMNSSIDELFAASGCEEHFNTICFDVSEPLLKKHTTTYRDPWKWSDGSKSFFKFWLNGEPGSSENCVTADLYDSGGWVGQSCEGKHPFVCYKQSSKNIFLKVRLTKNSGADLTDKTVQNDILQKIKHKLKGQGFDENKLTWRTKDGKVFRKEDEL
ncbi:uncharacterized protein LOC134859752 isoform X1 [Eleginops maclovinus]|uniref:uncharacterized protein LOC134859752 isoform X1 n=1 Tax=Eleginops maclovinus TaxID=56733 RepID=UPI0030807E55